MKELIIIGHKNPDTDSIVTPLVLAEFLKKIKKPFSGLSAFKIIKVVRAGNLNKETKFVLNYFQEKKPPLIKSLTKKNVFLIDHGDYEQAARGIKEANIVGILDHHKLGGIRTQIPIFYRAEPIGSSSTIVAKMFFENNLSLDKKTAGLLLAGILSDTLKFTSPTTTKDDKEVAKVLAKASKENIDELSQKMFDAKSDISGISAEEIVATDYKEFKTAETDFAIGVHETTCPQRVLALKEDIFPALRRLKKKRKMDLLFFALIDILKKNSTFFLLGEKEKKVAQKVFKKKEKDNLIFLPRVVSRKKQILPPLINFLEKNEIRS
jgi:manganese-dependent inorganic pyrophosphatase